MLSIKNILSLGRVTFKYSYTNVAKRSLYSANALGLDGYTANRDKFKTQFLNNEQKFRDKMLEFVEDKPGNMIFTEDLKSMSHLAENTPQDLQLLEKMIKRFHSQNKELRFGKYIFGPIIMRLFYHLETDDLALKLFMDPELEGFFDQLISYQILCDLLYKKQRYQDILHVFSSIESRQIGTAKYPRQVMVLVMAACYKLNTKESFDYCIDLMSRLNDVGHTPMRKAATFAAALALNQNSPHITIELLTSVRNQLYMTVRNLKVLAYAEIGRPDDALPILRSILELEDPVNNNKRTFVREVVDKLRESIEKNYNKDIEADFNRIEKFLQDNNQITNETLDEILCAEINFTPLTSMRERNLLAASFKNQRNSDMQRKPRQYNRPQQRLGLRELY